MSEHAPVGKTKDQGWEIGVRRTIEVGAERAWELLMTRPGLGLWLGNNPDLKFEKGATFQTRDGTTGKVVSFYDGQMIRLRWQPKGWDAESTLQVRVTPSNAKDKTTVSFHHEKLQDSKQREQMQKHWSAVLDNLSKLVAK